MRAGSSGHRGPPSEAAPENASQQLVREGWWTDLERSRFWCLGDLRCGAFSGEFGGGLRLRHPGDLREHVVGIPGLPGHEVVQFPLAGAVLEEVAAEVVAAAPDAFDPAALSRLERPSQGRGARASRADRRLARLGEGLAWFGLPPLSACAPSGATRSAIHFRRDLKVRRRARAADQRRRESGCWR